MESQPTLLLLGEARLGAQAGIHFDLLQSDSESDALALLEHHWVQILLIDCPQERPIADFLAQVSRRWPEVVHLLIDHGHRVYPDGLTPHQCLPADCPGTHLDVALTSALRLHRLQRENRTLGLELQLASPGLVHKIEHKRRQLRQRYGFDCLLRADGSPMAALCDLAGRIAPYNIPVLLSGESGTGKELMARALHYNSPRADRPFVVQNCAALPEQLLESELFGHRKGAFTGACHDHPGLFVEADGGTVFLDEIGEISPAFQVRLLRVLQSGELRPLGSSRTRHVDLRVITATNQDLKALIGKGRFREDLYYRLAGFALHLPPLRERPIDIEPIVTGLLDELLPQFGKPVRGITPQTLHTLQQHRWPGNVRELRNEIQRMLALCEGPWLEPNLLSSALQDNRAEPEPKPITGDLLGRGPLRSRIERLERCILHETLQRHCGNKTRTADELGLSRVGLRNKLQRYGLEGPTLN